MDRKHGSIHNISRAFAQGFQDFCYQALRADQGTWQSYIENYPTPGGVTDEDYERNVQLAAGIQTNYDRLFENYLNEGMSAWKAQALASANALQAGQKEKKEYFNFIT